MPFLSGIARPYEHWERILGAASRIASCPRNCARPRSHDDLSTRLSSQLKHINWKLLDKLAWVDYVVPTPACYAAW